MATSEVPDLDPYPALVNWLENCLLLSGAGEGFSMDIEDLADGTTIASCLQHIAPDHFTSNWGTKIIPEASASWRLKLSNLKKILKSIEDFYSESLHITLAKFPRPEVAKIAEHGSQDDMARLLQLVLGIAIHCEHKERYIQGIMSMQESIQHTVMALIQELMSLESPSMVQMEVYKELEEQYQHTLTEFKTLQTQNDSLKQENFELKRKLTETEGELQEMKDEVKELKGKIPPDEFGTPGGVKLQRVNRKLEDIRKEKMKAEYERDELMSQISDLEARVDELERKNQDLLAENAEIPSLRDTVEELKYTEGKVKNYESVISQYKKKVEDMQEMKREMKSLQDKNMMFMQQNLDLEDELRRLSSTKELLDTQKQRINALENELAKEKLKSLEAAQDDEDKAVIIQSLNSEVKELRRQVENQISPATPLSEAIPLGTEMFKIPTDEESVDSASLMEAFTPELKEKMVRLEKENEILKKRVESNESPLPSVLTAESSSEDINQLHQSLADKSVRIKYLEDTLGKKMRELEELSNFKANFDQISGQLKAKDVEIEKLKKFLNKAKKIIESFGEKKSDTAADSAEIQQLKSHLQERDREIERLEKVFETERQTREREERLILSAWYNLGLKFHQLQSKERLTSQASFLTQQRQAALKRPSGTSVAGNI